MSITANYEPPQAANVGESVAGDERISGLAVEMNGPVTQEAIAAVREAASFLASGDPFADPTPSDGQDRQTSSEATMSYSIIR